MQKKCAALLASIPSLACTYAWDLTCAGMAAAVAAVKKKSNKVCVSCIPMHSYHVTHSNGLLDLGYEAKRDGKRSRSRKRQSICKNLSVIYAYYCQSPSLKLYIEQSPK